MWAGAAHANRRRRLEGDIALVDGELTGGTDAVTVDARSFVAVRRGRARLNHGRGLSVGTSEPVHERGEYETLERTAAQDDQVGLLEVAHLIGGADEAHEVRCFD